MRACTQKTANATTDKCIHAYSATCKIRLHACMLFFLCIHPVACMRVCFRDILRFTPSSFITPTSGRRLFLKNRMVWFASDKVLASLVATMTNIRKLTQNEDLTPQFVAVHQLGVPSALGSLPRRRWWKPKQQPAVWCFDRQWRSYPSATTPHWGKRGWICK